MTDAGKNRGDEPDAGAEREAERGEERDGAAAPDPITPAAEDAKRQDKTKDRPDSGQNEDG